MLRAACALCLILPMLAQAANPVTPAKWWGVVVGVGEYPQLGPDATLDGPPNDIPLVTTWLARQSVARGRITVLADHVRDADGMPTKAAILAALDAVAVRAAAGDSAFVYLAGHGSQVPQTDADEHAKADGMEEVFLPRDAGRWNATERRVPGAIRGRELGLKIEALRARGVFVWLVVDSCHSATLSRGAAVVGVRARALPPQALGAPLTSATGAAGGVEPAPLLRLSDGNLPGGYVAFYAAQTTEIAPELPLPAGAADRKVHGLFTFALLNGLAAGNPRSYRDLSHQVLAFYASAYPRTTPEFEGALDLPVGASGQRGAARRWPARNTGEEFEIAAGRLDDITPGTLLALSDLPARGRNAAPLGVLRVTRSDLTMSWARAVTDADSLKRWRVPQDRTSESGSGLVHVLQSSLDLTIRVAVLGEPSEAAAVAQLEKLLARPGMLPSGVERTRDVAAADLLLRPEATRVVILRSSAFGATEPRGAAVDLEGADGEPRLRDALLRAARATGLVRLAARFADLGGELEVDLRARDRSGQWRPVDASMRARIPFDAELAIQLQNIGPVDLDVTVLSVNDQFDITPIFPVDLETNRLRHGSARLEVRGWARPDGPYQIIVISEPALPGKPHDLSYLSQPGVSRAARATGFGAVLEKIGFERRQTRSAQDSLSSGRMRVLGYEVLESGALAGAPAR